LAEENHDQVALLALGALLRLSYTLVVEAIERGLHAAGYGDVRTAHFAVLQPLANLQPLAIRTEGARTTDLAAWAHLAKPSIVYLVDYLEAHGYVERTPDPVDGRAQRVRLTARGLDVVRTTRELARQVEVEWETRFGTSQVEQLKQILRNVVVSMSPRQ
jgi:DNA-binding MarR family transcriptional regulator